MRLLLPAVLAAALLAPVPASAATLDWGAANAAYDDGVQNGPEAKTLGDYVVCNAYWGAWIEAINDGRLTAEMQAKLHKELVPPNARFNALEWNLSYTNESDEVNAYYKDKKDTATWLLNKGLAGEQKTLEGVTSMLGGCQVPYDE